MKPLVVLDGTPHSIRSIETNLQGQMAYIVGANQAAFDKVASCVRARVFHFYEMRVLDISAISEIDELEELAIHWNTKIEDLSSISRLKNLKSLVLEDTPKIRDLSAIALCTKLVRLEFSGGIWNKNRAISLDPIAEAPAIRSLRLTNLAVEEGSIRALANAPCLEELDLSNQFPTEDYAYLAAKRPGVRCDYFAPYVFVKSELGGKDVMVIGSRKPFLNSKTDADRLQKYAQRFEKLIGGFLEQDKMDS